MFKTIFFRNTESNVLIWWKLKRTSNFVWVPGPLRPPLAVWGLKLLARRWILEYVLYNISPKYSLIRAHDESYLWRNIQKKLAHSSFSNFSNFPEYMHGRRYTNYCIYFKPRVQKIAIEMHWFYFVTCWSSAFKCWLPQLDLVTLQIYSSGIMWTISSANWSLEFGS